MSGIDVPKNCKFNLLNSVWNSTNENNQQASGSSSVHTIDLTPNNFEDNKDDENIQDDNRLNVFYFNKLSFSTVIYLG